MIGRFYNLLYIKIKINVYLLVRDEVYTREPTGLNMRRSVVTRRLNASPLLIGFVVCAYITCKDDVGRRGCLRRWITNAPIAASATKPVTPRPTPRPMLIRASSVDGAPPLPLPLAGDADNGIAAALELPTEA
jgi:hypothetical protein